jgi:hypothetical protein
VGSQARVQPPTFRFHRRGGLPVRVARSKRGRVPMCACGRGWLPLLLSASDREIPVFTGVNGMAAVRRLSLAGVILGLPSPAFLRSPTPTAREHSRWGRVPGQRTVMGALGPPGVGSVGMLDEHARRAWPGAGGVPGYSIPRLQLSSVGGVADGSMPRVIQEAVLRRDWARRSRKQEAACLTRTVQLTH